MKARSRILAAALALAAGLCLSVPAIAQTDTALETLLRQAGLEDSLAVQIRGLALPGSAVPLRWGAVSGTQAFGLVARDFTDGQAELSRDEKVAVLQPLATVQLLYAVAARDSRYLDARAAWQGKVPYPEALPALMSGVEGSVGYGSTVSQAFAGQACAVLVQADLSAVHIKSITILSEKDVLTAYIQNSLRLAREATGRGDAASAARMLLSLRKAGYESRELYLVLLDAYIAAGHQEEARRISDYLASRFPVPGQP